MTSASDPSQVGIRVGYYHNDYMYVAIIEICYIPRLSLN